MNDHRLIAACVVGLAVLTGNVGRSADARPPNIVFILADDKEY